jgi:DNA-binding MarR family transcriptional regulator
VQCFAPLFSHSIGNKMADSLLDDELIEALFLAYRDFIKEPDTLLNALGLGRAHHRALHFVYRKPDLSVAQLLEILQITKQSLNRVLNTLLEQGYIEQRMGDKDRRLRHLNTTDKGAKLARELAFLQHQRLHHALLSMQKEANDGIRATVLDFLQRLQDIPASVA